MRVLTCSVVLFMLVNFSVAQPVDNSQRQIVFRGVNIISMESDRVNENQTLIVKGGKIAYIGSDAGARPETGALVIDAKGKYVIPGLAEMHAHVPPIDNIEPMKEVLTLFLANGVTTIRGMLGHPRHLELRGKINSGAILGPHFYTTGPSFNGQSVKTPERGAEMVREQKTAGYDYLKLHPGLTKETFPAVASTAKEVGIPFAGHVSFGVGVWAAIDAGYSSIDHLDGFIEAVTPGVDTLAEQETGLFGSWIADRADVSRVPGLAKALGTGKIWLVPTQTLAERWLSPEPASVYLAAPEMKYMSKQILTGWENSKNSYMNNPQYSQARAQKLINVRREMIRQCHKAGVGIILGSDAPQVFNVPGFSAHHELRAMVDSGLSPYEALKTATVNVAAYLGKSAESGTITTGKVSDFVLLGGNPLKDIGETKKVEGVMIGNQWLSRGFIDVELSKIEKK